MYNISDLARKLQRQKREVYRICRQQKLGKEGCFDDTDLAFLRDFMNKDKRFLMDKTLSIIRNNPFISEKEITQKLGRATSYTRWIISELTYENPDLSETDEGLLFLLSDDTISELSDI